MKCGHCKAEGVAVEHVRQCAGVGSVTTLSRETFSVAPDKPRGESMFDGPQADEPPSTDAQRGYIAKLRGYKGLEPLAFTGTKRQASAEIDRLKGLPDKQPRKVAVPEGIYEYEVPGTEGETEVYKVQMSHYGDGAGHVYAKKLVLVERTPEEMHPNHPEWTHKGEWEHASGMQYRLKEADRMHVEVARQYGVLYGFCVRCGRILEREDSIERGMGPKCAAKMEGE